MPGPAPRPGISTSTAPTWRTPGWPGSNAPLIDGRDWPDEVESPAGRRQPRHLEGQRAAAPARRARHGELLCCVGDPVTAGARKSAALSRGVPPDELLATRPSATMILIHELRAFVRGCPQPHPHRRGLALHSPSRPDAGETGAGGPSGLPSCG